MSNLLIPSGKPKPTLSEFGIIVSSLVGGNVCSNLAYELDKPEPNSKFRVSFDELYYTLISYLNHSYYVMLYWCYIVI